MLLIGCSLALLVIYAGMKLMAQTEKENLGKMYKYVSMFLVLMGFLMIAGVACCGIMRCCHRGGGHMMERKMRMMHENNFEGEGCMGGQMGHHNMFFKRRFSSGGCCGEMMRGGCGHEMNNCCDENMEGCHEKMMGKCHGDNEECDEESEECPMRKGECKKDSVVTIMKKK